VLNKYQPEHVWKHGDVFKTRTDLLMIYFKYDAAEEPEQIAICLQGPIGGPSIHVENSLADATFLFNIKENIGD